MPHSVAQASQSVLDALVISADESLCLRLESTLESLGQGALSVSTLQQAREAMNAVFFPLLIVERNLTDGDALGLCREYRRRHADRRVSIVLLCDSNSSAPMVGIDACIDRTSSDAEFRARLARRTAQTTTSPRSTESNDVARVAALTSYGILDTPPERDYDDIVLIASHIARTPMAALSLLDGDRQWFKSHIGMPFAQTPRDDSFCTHTVEQPDRMLVVNDATADRRFAKLPMVVGAPHVRFYAGAALMSHDGVALGTVCVLDNKPREIDAASLEALAALARQAVTVLEHRRRAFELQEALTTSRRIRESLLQSEVLLREAFDNASIGKALVSHTGEFLRVNRTLCDIVGYTQDELLSTNFQALTYADDLAADLSLMNNVLDGSLRRYELEKRYIHKRGHIVWVLLSVSIVRDETGAPLYFLAEIQDITERKRDSASPRVSIVFGSVRTA